MKRKLFIAIIVSLTNYLICDSQNIEINKLKKYSSYLESGFRKSKYWNKNYLKNGLIVLKEYYYGSKLLSREQFEHDQKGNVNREIYLYDINEGELNEVQNIQLIYDGNNLIEVKKDWGVTIRYSNFNKFNKAELIEYTLEDKCYLFPCKQILEFDELGNHIKTTEYNKFINEDGEVSIEIKEIKLVYDKYNNIIAVQNKYIPEVEFPIMKTGGLPEYENEYYHYKYNPEGLWTKKYKIINGKKIRVGKRRFKK